MLSSSLFLCLIIAKILTLAFWLEQTVSWARKVGATLLVIALGALVSNLGLVPESSVVYDTIFGPVTSLAIVWLLLAVNFADLKKAGPFMLGVFGFAVLGTAVGALIGAVVFKTVFPDDFWKLAGTLTGTYAGGSLNFVAVGRALELPATLFSATSAADNVVTAVWFGLTLMLPAWFARPKGTHSDTEKPREVSASPTHPLDQAASLNLFDLAALMALGLGLIWLSRLIGHGLEHLGLGGIPSIIFLSTLALLVGHIPAIRRLQGAFLLGYFAMHIFFVVIGIYSKIPLILEVGLEVFYFTLLVVAIHGIFLFFIAHVLRWDKVSASVASQAAIGGPSTALAIAISLKRHDLALPGLVVGMLGYGVGTYLGLGVAYLCKTFI